jgi:hypothetical protein
MTRDELNNEYFDWMYQLVCNEKYFKGLSHRKLLNYLHGVDFTYTIAMDGNRAEDGTDLRYRFGYERNYPGPMIASYLDDKPCSVLEMLVALTIRCEEHIMDDPDVGNRTGQWFWNMIVNLGLGRMNDLQFSKPQVEAAVSKLLDRRYERTGEGGLFTIKNCNRDLRSVEIWYQLCWYLDEVLGTRR